MAKSDLKIRPIGSKILVKPEEREEKTKGGIYLPDTASKEKPQKGKIVATGPGAQDENGKVKPLQVKTGDNVMFKKYSPDTLEVDGVEYLIMDEDDVLAVLG